MLAEIITIGDEILIGQTVDTNSAWLGKELNKRGIDILRISSIKDTSPAIKQALHEAEQRADVILLTGGLGPTNDDVTKETLASYFNAELVSNTEALQNIEKRFKARGIAMLQINIEQALVPDNCDVIQNGKGTAPGMWFQRNSKTIVSMPGVPYEMKAMMSEFVFPRLENQLDAWHIEHQTITVVNIPESVLSNDISDIEASLPPYIKMAFLPHLNIVRLRLSAKSPNHSKADLRSELNSYFDRIKSRIGNSWFDGDHSLATIIGQMLKTRKLTLGTIESCTGGYISHSITVIPGSSAYFLGSYITYSNQLKIDLIGVDANLFTTVGSVSEEVAHQMAIKGKAKLGVDYCISATGIAGPTGATDTKEVGLVYIGLAGPNGLLEVKKNQFRGSREQIIERTAYAAMEMLRQVLTIQNEQKPAPKSQRILRD
ncbi:MAG: competence/damage-inducible protein A [Bacteroidia bacterium]